MESIELSDLISEDDLRQFKTDVQENLNDLEDALLQLEGAPEDMELVGRVFRSMHTIKGTASMYGFEEASRLTHHVENFYDRLRNGRAVLDRRVIDLTLSAKDQVAAMILNETRVADADEVERIKVAFAALNEETKSAEAPPGGERSAASHSRKGGLFNIRFRFRPTDPVFRRATNPLIYLNSLRQLGECEVVCHTDALPPLEELDVGTCHFQWDVLLTADCTEDAVRGEFIFIEDELEALEIRKVTPPGPEEELHPPKLGELLVERGDLSEEALQGALVGKTKLGEELVAQGKVAESRVRAALTQQRMVRDVIEKSQKEAVISSVRVSSEKLDDLINLVGELVIAQARLRQIIDQREEEPELASVSEDISRLTENLRDGAMGIRMLPIGALFSRFNRLVRDLTRDLGKEVELVTQGGETELDKTVIENLNDPLVHILRNSIDHGVETPQQRLAAGKPSKGVVRLSAIHSGAHVLVRVEDDGRGLDPQKIRAKALAKRLIPPDANLSDQEIFNLIFLPGFSTAETITSVSGRGVGMDVVKKTIDSLRGEISVASSPGRGMTLTIQLPLTLAIIDGFLVQSGDEQFVLPLSTVKECVKLTRRDVADAHDRQIINIRNEIVPYVRLRDVFRLDEPGKRLDKEQVVITEVDRNRMGMVVDRVIGQSQVVIKSLGEVFRDVSEFSGATILGNGRVVSILDVGRIMETAKNASRL